MALKLGLSLQDIALGRGGPILPPESYAPLPPVAADMSGGPTAPAKKPGFFGEGGMGRYLAGVIGDALAQSSGFKPIFMPMQQAAQQSALEEAIWSRRQAAEQAAQRGEKQWEWANKPDTPTEFERLAKDAGIAPGTPDWQQTMHRRLENALNPFMPVPTVDANGNPAYTYVPKMPPTSEPGSISGPPKEAVDHLRAHPELKSAFDAKYGEGMADRYMGGGSGNAAGGFPR